EPRRHDAPAAPHLGDVGQVEVVLVMLRLAQRRGLGVHLVTTLAHVGRTQDAEAFRVGRHDPVLDPVVDHLDEVAAAVRAARELPRLSGGGDAWGTGGAGNTAGPGGEGGKDGVGALPPRVLTADHQAISALAAPDAAAGADVHVVNALVGELLRAPDIV